MVETALNAEGTTAKGRKSLVIGLIGAIATGAAGFAVTYLGFIGSPLSSTSGEQQAAAEPLPQVSFVALDPLTISLGPDVSSKHLRFAAQLEVGPGFEEEVSLMRPRVTDVLNGYLRAVEVTQLQDPAALPRLKAQMLRRIQIVTGEGRVKNLLISEFVLN